MSLLQEWAKQESTVVVVGASNARSQNLPYNEQQKMSEQWQAERERRIKWNTENLTML